MKCLKCGIEYEGSFKFCPNCAEPNPLLTVDATKTDVEPGTNVLGGQEESESQKVKTAVPGKRDFFSSIKNLSFKTWITIASVAVILVIGLVVGLVLGLGGGEEETTKNETSYVSSNKTTSDVVLNNENWGKVCSSPSKYEGSKVNGLVGRIFADPEISEDAVAIQMFADPQNSSENTIVYYYGSGIDSFSNGDLIMVTGEVGPEFTGENMMGASLVVPTIIADTIENTDASSLIQGGKEIAVNQQQNQNGVVIVVDKVVLGDEETDVFVRIANQSGTNATFYDFNAKLQAGNQQFEIDSMKQYEYGEISSDILPGVEVSGILVFPSLGEPLPATGSFALHLEASSENYRLDFNPYVFNISW